MNTYNLIVPVLKFLLLYKLLSDKYYINMFNDIYIFNALLSRSMYIRWHESAYAKSTFEGWCREGSWRKKSQVKCSKAHRINRRGKGRIITKSFLDFFYIICCCCAFFFLFHKTVEVLEFKYLGKESDKTVFLGLKIFSKIYLWWNLYQNLNV